MMIPRKQRGAKDVQGVLLGIGLLLVVSSWLWLPSVVRADRLWQITSNFRSHEGDFRREAARAIRSPGKIGRETAETGRLADGSPVVFLPLSDRQEGYLHTERALGARDLDAGGSLILKDGQGDLGSGSFSITRTLKPGWYSVAREES